jgi:hypothetical protein
MVLLTASILLCLFGSAYQPVSNIIQQGGPTPPPVTHQHFNQLESLLSQNSTGPLSASDYRNPPNPICAISSSGPNANTDCEGTNPHNETSLAVNPTNPLNIIGGANDYQWIRHINSNYIIVHTRAHTTFDGGQTWSMVPISYKNYAGTGDPAVAFDAGGAAYMATLGFVWSQGFGFGTAPDILVSTSRDGGKNWSDPAVVAKGTGSYLSPTIFNDKEYLTAWGNGNAIVTWTVFHSGLHGAYLNSPIYASVTHDYGQTWSPGVSISGSASFCDGSAGDTACDQDQGSVPVVAADGSIYVAFISQSNHVDFRSQVLVVKVDPVTGQRIAGPFKAASLVDGITDYPINADFRQTYQDSQFRTWSPGNLTADPTNASHLAIAWSDMRNSPLPANPDPYQAITDSDVSVAESLDGGLTWSAPLTIRAAGDQFMPWAAFDANGLLRIGYYDRSYDPANHKYGYTLATRTGSGTLAFSTARVSTALSDPTRGNRWFYTTKDPAFPYATTFIGDYSGIAILPTGVAALWTDLRETACYNNLCRSGMDAYFGTLK